MHFQLHGRIESREWGHNMQDALMDYRAIKFVVSIEMSENLH